ncbi:HU family DNA-binding protein [Kitasatospora purpeofusca]|uniref:HU family DNA-binding protein n=1 Tax=Kitasatospora purpeofusca TaxID=67352 RepID=UPI0035D57E10
MNKTELIDAIAERADVTKVAAGKALDAFTKTITSSLQDQDEVDLNGFGVFSVKAQIPGFKAGKVLKDAVN